MRYLAICKPERHEPLKLPAPNWAAFLELCQAFIDKKMAQGAIELPENAHNVCFGGPNFCTLYITATHGFYSLDMATRGALNGSPHRQTKINTR